MWTIAVRVPAACAPLFQSALEPFCVAVAAEADGDHWRVTGYADRPPSQASLAAALAIAAAASGIAPPNPLVAQLAERDWLAENRRSFPALSVGRFYVYRSHHARPPADGRVAIRLDAGVAFGSGTHASTQGCLLALDRLARKTRPRAILDLGTGSGILAIAAAKAWPARVLATDIDAAAVRVATLNAAANGVAGRIEARAGAGFAPVAKHRRFDLILANIHLGPLAAMAAQVAAHVAWGGRAVLSGLLRADEAEAAAIYRAQRLTLEARFSVGDWVTLILRRQPRKSSICRR
jgi:ribosomal protein L11 methyltransferase